MGTVQLLGIVLIPIAGDLQSGGCTVQYSTVPSGTFRKALVNHLESAGCSSNHSFMGLFFLCFSKRRMLAPGCLDHPHALQGFYRLFGTISCVAAS